MGLYIKEVDIYQYPISKSTRTHKKRQLTIGDLHGNALKLLYFLIRENIFHLSKTDYHQIVAIYRKDVSQLESKDIRLFNVIIQSLKKVRPATIRLIGDELSDRGSNDYFTLKILEKIGKARIPIRILFSNHGIEFLRAYESNFKACDPNLGEGQARSLKNLDILIKNAKVKTSELNKIITEYYLKKIKLLDYSLHKKKNTIILYSHAPIGLETVKSLARKLGIVYSDTTRALLAKTIDALNRQFQKKVYAGEIVPLSEIDKVDFQKNTIPIAYPLVRIIWNRNYTWNPPDLGYHIEYVHGHDGAGFVARKFQKYVINLDNILGKYYRYTENNIGQYSIFIMNL